MGICPLHNVYQKPLSFDKPLNYPKKLKFRRKIYCIDQKKLEISIQMSKYYTSNSCNYYSSIDSNYDDLSKKLRGNSLITYKSSCNMITNEEKNNWMSIINNWNESEKEEKVKNDTEIQIEDLNFKRKMLSIIKDDVSTKDNTSKSGLKSSHNEQIFENYCPSLDLDTMPSVREEYKNKLNVKSTFEPIFIEKLNKYDLDSQSERVLFLNKHFENKEKDESSTEYVKLKKDIFHADRDEINQNNNYRKTPQKNIVNSLKKCIENNPFIKQSPNNNHIYKKNQRNDDFSKESKENLKNPTFDNFQKKTFQNSKKITFEDFHKKGTDDKRNVENYQKNDYDKENFLQEKFEKIQIKQKINNEEVANPLKKLKIKERRLSRISSKNSFDEPSSNFNDIASITIKDLSVPYNLPLKEKPLLEYQVIQAKHVNKNNENYTNEKYLENKHLNEKNNKNDDYIEKFLNHNNPLRKTFSEFQEVLNQESSSSLYSMKNYFKNMRDLKLNDMDDVESFNSEELLNSRVRIKSSTYQEKIKQAAQRQMTEEEIQDFIDQTESFLNNKENTSYDLNNFITDMMEIYMERNKDKNIEKNEKIIQNFDFDKENLNKKLKCLSPVYREMKISARNSEQNKWNENSLKKQNSFHDVSSYEHRKSSYILPNYYQKNRDFSQFTNHFSKEAGTETKYEEHRITYRDIKEKNSFRKFV